MSQNGTRMGAPSYTVYAIQYKTVDADQRIIEGIASTPAPDRLGGVRIAGGAGFTLPMPLLWQHDLNKPIGQVLSATVTAAGIKIRAQIAKGIAFIDDQAWPMINSGRGPGLSTG